MLSLIIPTLKTPDGFLDRLDTLNAFVDEIVISSADLEDPGVKAAQDKGYRVIPSEKGRGTQLHNGAIAALGNWFLFLHADTSLEEEWFNECKWVMDTLPNKAAYFSFQLDDQSRDAQWLEKSVAWRCRTFGLPYGDQGLLISKEHYEKIGGYPKIPLMEDVALVRKIGKKNLIGLKSKAITSAEKYQKGYKLRSARNLFCLSLYLLGASPEFIKKIYG